MVVFQPSMSSVSFIGEGALLSRAIVFCLNKNIKVGKIFVPKNNINIQAKNVNIIPFNKDTLSDLLLENIDHDDFLFSINNKYLIEDISLKKIKNVYNIHNGLVQKYRGLGEVCVFCAYLNKENIYGATLHRIKPNQQPDGGEIFAQKSFLLKEGYSFQEIMTRSIKCCQEIFEENIIRIINKEKSINKIEDDAIGCIYTYKNIDLIIENAKDINMDLGVYEKDLYKIKKIINKIL